MHSLLIPDLVPPVEEDGLVLRVDHHPRDLTHDEVGAPVVHAHWVGDVVEVVALENVGS